MNLPNKVTLLRIGLIPVFLIIYLAQPFPEIVNMWLAMVIFIIASITDAIDGHLARKHKLVTNFGKLIDPLADKLLICSALVAFTFTGSLWGQFGTWAGQFSVWAVIILISREFYVSGLRLIVLEQGKVLPALKGGKLKMGLQIALVVVVLLPMQMLDLIPVQFFWFEWLFILHRWAVLILLALSTIVSVTSAVDYTRKNKDVFSKI
ncbi:MAG: CDP-diacylglycerol--glycerol-3-phosphate 3-phosphatidyltransferase [Defluviitaleaceae bacterium]|nr:CDP-diacylglycerol--glycerol-3-phosphate 3-phosphatidyltransferase [Defluviitaleaceae bacterium]